MRIFYRRELFLKWRADCREHREVSGEAVKVPKVKNDSRNSPVLVAYIENQRDHHAKQTFEDGYISALKLNDIDYDERYVFD